MENCKADNIAEKLFRSYWKQGKSSLCKKCYKGLSINSCFVDVNAIKNALLKHQQIYSKIPTLGAVQVLRLELHPWFHFLRFFLSGTLIFRKTWESFFLLECVKQEFTLFVSICFFKKSDVLYFFLQADYF